MKKIIAFIILFGAAIASAALFPRECIAAAIAVSVGGVFVWAIVTIAKP